MAANNKGNKKGGSRGLSNAMAFIYIPLIILLVYMLFNYKGGDPVKVEWYEVKESMIPQGDVEKMISIKLARQVERIKAVSGE